VRSQRRLNPRLHPAETHLVRDSRAVEFCASPNCLGSWFGSAAVTLLVVAGLAEQPTSCMCRSRVLHRFFWSTFPGLASSTE